MHRHLRRVGFIGFLSVVLMLAAVPSAATAKKAPSAKRQTATAFKHLMRDTRQLNRTAVSRANRARLLRAAARARKLSRLRPCAAVKVMRRYAKGLRKVRERKIKGRRPTAAGKRGLLQADVLEVQVALMQMRRAKRCGGGKRAKVASATQKVLRSDNKRLRMRLSLPSPTFATQKVGERLFQQMFMEGTGESGDVGKPGIPQVSKFFGVPNGATIKLEINGTEGYDIPGVELYPHQESAVDLSLPPGAPEAETFADKPFELDAKFYDSPRTFPAKPSEAGSIGNIRDLDVGGVDFAGGQYRPRSNTLHVFTSIDVTVTFAGDSKGHFGTADGQDGVWDVFFNRNYKSLIENVGAVVRFPGELRPANWCGEEMLVITSPALATAAETFRAGKVAQGISTSVRFVGSAPGQIGTTNEQIQSFIRSRLNGGCIIRPTYVVLLGNTASVPTFLVPCGPGGNPDECNIASDLPYSLNGVSSDLFADVMLGRIPVTDPADADAVVNKILTYQNTPPAPPGDDFYSHATVTGYFQPAMMCVLDEGATDTPNCNGDAPPVTGHWEIDYANHRDTRGFTKTSEAVRRAMAANSYDVDRLFTTDDEDVIPEEYYDGTPIPAGLRRPAEPWDADTTDFLNAYNAGRFLILHRDHGWPDGWAEPTLHSGHVPGFTNGSELPVVFGINCSSAAFDDPAHPSFVELQVRRIGGGAVAGFGDTRVSPSFPNNHMTRGFFDALFPNLQPEFGSITPTRRLGDVLVLGKQFMATQEGMDWHGAGDTYVEHYLYHLLGDPSMQMWAAEPKTFAPPKIDSRYVVGFNPGDPPWRVQIKFPIGGGDPPPLNTVATLFSGGAAIGRAIVGRNGEATIVPEAPGVQPSNLRVTFNQDGVLPASDSVDGAPTQAPAEKQSTTLRLTGDKAVGWDAPLSYTGAISPAFAGATIRIVVTKDATTESYSTTATTDGAGDYAATIDPPGNPNGANWHAQAFFDGDPTYAASESNVHDTAERSN
jgi:hypothetical protein